MKKLNALVVLWLALPLITLANPYHPPVDPCHYHPCPPTMVETPEPSSLILVMGTAMIWAGWRLAKKAKGGGE